MSYLYYFDKSRMADDESVQGVPRESLTQEAYNGLPAWLQATVDKHPAYRKQEAEKPKAAPRKKAAKPKPAQVTSPSTQAVEAPAPPVVEEDNGRS